MFFPPADEEEDKRMVHTTEEDEDIIHPVNAAAKTLTEILPAEQEALLRWRRSLYYYEYAIVPSWNATSSSCNRRITCSEEGSVIGIDLSYHHLEGNLNHLNFSSLPHLSVLILQGNKLNGTIPQEIGALTNLITLNFKSNLFVGDLPISLGNLTSLVVLDLSNNNLNGLITIFRGIYHRK
ncbi:Leucine-rich repeat (LRR) family protein [Thalictrum thalictroides]|uniref:Leucine-rich repeat (LRR) family protein n=1 Tax=Thalictrum thalictroides TaxID=46969 RepID=A0A7J6VI03_THATH|nr:Leucine-rich repeat (LRR) family protein [Thalictrum thalictroides]